METFAAEDPESLIDRLETIWRVLWNKGVDRAQMLSASMLSPATCCLINPDKEATVQRAVARVNRIAAELKTRYQLN